jgi:16S rRNA (cytidine1402-2'-O)-methyltransferase
MNPGTLFVVATPLGNLGDLSPRAAEVLAQVALIAAEDTRVTRRLLQHIGCDTPMLSLHDHNESQRVAGLLERLQVGEDVALVSDAGTPLISDPGYTLVRAVRQARVKVVPIPGPSALVTALSVAGLPTDRFVFEGFLSAKPAARRARLKALAQESRTLVFYESPHRILATLADLRDVLGAEREAVVARELTKTFETVHGDQLGALCEWAVADSNQQRGEFVLVVAGASEVVEAAKVDEEHLLQILLEELSVKQAAGLAARITGAKRNALYTRALELQKDKNT